MKRRKPFSLYRRKSGVWFVRVWDEAAKSYTSGKSTGETDRDAAAARAAEMIKAGQIKPREQDPFFLDHLREYWHTREKDVSAAYYRETIKAIENRVATFKDFQKIRLSHLKPAHVHRFIDHLKKQGVTVRPINRVIQFLKTYLSWAYSRDYITADIAGKIQKEKEPKSTRGFLTPDEIIKLAGLEWSDLRIKAAVALGLFAGLRRGEVLALQWGDIDFDKNTIDVRRNFVGEFDANGNAIFKAPKTGSDRKFPYLIFKELKNTLLELLRETPFKRPDDLVLCNVWYTQKFNGSKARPYRPMNEITIRRDYGRMLAAIGIPREEQQRRKLVYHGLRHSFASLVAMVAPINSAMPLTGHRRVSTFEGYAHSVDESAIGALNAANRELDRYRNAPAQIDDETRVIN